MKNTTEIIIKIIMIIIIILGIQSNASAFGWWTPEEPGCFYWWCAPIEEPETPTVPTPEPTPEIIPVVVPDPIEQTVSINIQTPLATTSISPMFVFGKSDVDRYTTFKAQLNNSELSTRAKYYMDGILLEYGLNQTEFENKFGLI